MLLACADAENGWLNTDQVRFLKLVAMDDRGSQWMLAAFCHGDPTPVPLYYGHRDEVSDAVEAYALAVKSYQMASLDSVVKRVQRDNSRADAERARIEQERASRLKEAEEAIQKETNRLEKFKPWATAFLVVWIAAVVIIVSRRPDHPPAFPALPIPRESIGPWSPFLAFYLGIGLTVAVFQAVYLALSITEGERSYRVRSTAFVLALWPVVLVEYLLNGLTSAVVQIIESRRTGH